MVISTSRKWVVCLFASIITSSCVAGGWGADLGATIDAHGNFGISLRGQLEVGFATGNESGVRLTPGAASGFDIPTRNLQLSGVTGIDWMTYSTDDLGLGAGLRAGWLGEFNNRETEHNLYYGIPLSILFVYDYEYERGHEKGLSPSGRTYYSVGPIIEPGIAITDEDTDFMVFLGAGWRTDFFTDW